MDGDLIIRTSKHVTITEAHPYHNYLRDDRARGGTATVAKSYDENCPLCREEKEVSSGVQA
jgi:hypothetical protein